MRLVLDVIFLEALDFQLDKTEWKRCQVERSQEEVLRAALVLVGLELIDYGSFVAKPYGLLSVTIDVYSKAYRERAERATASR